MAKVSESKPLLPSVIDRLIDLEPHNEREVAKSRSQVLRELKQSVRRDLEFLLNTRCRCTFVPSDLVEVKTSVLTYGLADFTGLRSSTVAFREELREWVADAIRRFEPRIKTADVQVLPSNNQLSRVLRFRIDALLHAEPAPEPVVFDSTLEASSGNVTIEQAKL